MTHPVQLKVSAVHLLFGPSTQRKFAFHRISVLCILIFRQLNYLPFRPPRVGRAGREFTKNQLQTLQPPLVCGEREHIKLYEMCQDFLRLILSNICQTNMTIRLGVSKFFLGTLKCQKKSSERRI